MIGLGDKFGGTATPCSTVSRSSCGVLMHMSYPGPLSAVEPPSAGAMVPNADGQIYDLRDGGTGYNVFVFYYHDGYNDRGNLAGGSTSRP